MQTIYYIDDNLQTEYSGSLPSDSRLLNTETKRTQCNELSNTDKVTISKYNQVVKSFPSHMTHIGAALTTVSLALSQTPVYTARLRHGYGANASRGVPVYVPAFVGSLVLIAPTHGGMARLS